MKDEGLWAAVGYGSKPRYRGGPVGVFAKVMNREFSRRAYEGWLYLAAVMDLYSRQIVGWATRSAMSSDLVLPALLAAVWKRKPRPSVMVHSDQGPIHER